MGIDRLIGKGHFGGGRLIEQYIAEALEKKKKTGKSFDECLEECLNDISDMDFSCNKNAKDK